MGKKEEITDLISDRAIKNPLVIHKGKVLVFQMEDDTTTIKITKVDRKNCRVWGEHIDLIEMQNVVSHENHNVDMKKRFCNDCKSPIGVGATEEGNVRAIQRSRNDS